LRQTAGGEGDIEEKPNDERKVVAWLFGGLLVDE
jgi:hypothetical protein